MFDVPKKKQLKRIKVEKVKQKTAQDVLNVGGKCGRLFAWRVDLGGLEFGTVVGAVLDSDVVLGDALAKDAVLAASFGAIMASVRFSVHCSLLCFFVKTPN